MKQLKRGNINYSRTTELVENILKVVTPKNKETDEKSIRTIVFINFQKLAISVGRCAIQDRLAEPLMYRPDMYTPHMIKID